MLGNFSDFDVTKDARPVADMGELDRFILHRLYQVTKKAVTAYDTYEFHTIYHALHNFCVVDLSAFYLDIIKDRLYTSPPASPERRDAQTVMAVILDTLVRIMAPLLPFTAEEIYAHMPPGKDKKESVHMASMAVADPQWENRDLSDKWTWILSLRSEVTKALEAARKDKLIGHPLDAAVEIRLPETELKGFVQNLDMPLADIFIVSSAVLKDTLDSEAFQSREIAGLEIAVKKAAGEKCERCWRFSQTIGQDDQYPEACDRCASALNQIL
jgi:isoleucyl-tRNA synthetase